MRVWSLQVLRFFAALAVVFFHAAGAVNFNVHRVGALGLEHDRLGQAGVDIFFVLSGVIIAMTAKGLTAKAFICKRATRILPLYWAVLIPYLAAGLIAGTVGWREVFGGVSLWPAFDRMISPVVPVSWTLSYEVLFYAATALVLWRRVLALPLSALFLAALATRQVPVTQFLGNPLILEFLVGVGLTRLPRTPYGAWVIPAGLITLWVFGPQGYSMTTGALEGVEAWRRVGFFGAPAAVIVWGAMQIAARPSFLSYLGETSYALYLTHPPVVLGVCWLLCRVSPLPPDAVALTATLVSVFVGWRIHEAVERPMLLRLRQAGAGAGAGRLSGSRRIALDAR